MRRVSIPGSQDWPVKLDHDVSETVPAEMAKGSCLLYTGKVYHGGGANQSDAVRTGLNLTYCVAWLRQEENQYLSCPPEVTETLDDELLKLMGYQIGAYALGYVDDVRDPLDALRGATGAMGFGVEAEPPRRLIPARGRSHRAFACDFSPLRGRKVTRKRAMGDWAVRDRRSRRARHSCRPRRR